MHEGIGNLAASGLPGYWPQLTPGHTAGNAALSLADRDVLIVGDTLATLSLPPGESGPQLLPRFLNEDHDRALASLEKIEPVQARWVLPGHGLPWQGSPQQAVKLARQIAARTRGKACPAHRRKELDQPGAARAGRGAPPRRGPLGAGPRPG